MESDNGSFEAAVRTHDAAITACGLDIWIGAEPTFTNRRSLSPEWLTDALGETKQTYACHIIEQLHARAPGSIILRTLGRQYAREEQPRWSMGLYQRRDARLLAEKLPTDPLGSACVCDADRIEAFWQALVRALDCDGWAACGFRTDGESGLRVLFGCNGQRPAADPASDARLERSSLHRRPIPADGAVDDLAAEGLYLVALGCLPIGPQNSLQPCIELPALPDVATFLAFVRRVAQAATESDLRHLVWRGFPPPVDETVAWTTLTPDPAVLEINAAPAATASDFLAMSRALYTVAETAELSPYRLQYNGVISESGGGGQFTLGGPTPERSPFFLAPRLLAQLVVYLNHHPSLSYWFAPIYIGSFSQSPRADENVFESFSELQVALRHFAAAGAPEPEFIWRSLSPFLVDTSGNAHRSELNIEKLWNPFLPGRGRLGLVEFRAFRMAPDAETATAIAILLRSLAAMLSHRHELQPLIEWGGRLHDRFSLPFYLRQDLRVVFDDLTTVGVGLDATITKRLTADDWRHIGDVEFADWRLSVERAIEFWPLLGDSAAQQGGSRLVDASTTRLQLMLRRLHSSTTEVGDCILLANGYRLPLRREMDENGVAFIIGLRYRAFAPWTGLHPGLGAQGPVVLALQPPGSERGLRVTLYDWQPQGNAYDGLPDSLAEARRRICERFVVEEIALEEFPDLLEPPPESLSEHCLDLRRI